MKLAIVGFGFVGSAVNQGFTKNIEKFILDPKHFADKTYQDLIAFEPDASFVCVPTPQKQSGECDSGILLEVIGELHKIKNHLVIVKSTAPAYVFQEIQKQYSSIKLVYNPEFLTEKNAFHDFCNPKMHIFGGASSDTNKTEMMYKNHSICQSCPVFKVDIITASMLKYCINSFLASKVIFMNEMYSLLQKAGVSSWENFTDIIATDPRIGKSHLKVPGYNNERGYGGSCFPKDTKAIAWYAREILKSPLEQLEATIKINEGFKK